MEEHKTSCNDVICRLVEGLVADEEKRHEALYMSPACNALAPEELKGEAEELDELVGLPKEL